MVNRESFFKSIRASLFGGKLTQSQVDGMSVLLDAFEARGGLPAPWKAYMLATAYHECAGTMQPIEEFGKGKGRKYGKKLDVDGTVYRGLDHIYYGRGYVQLTWLTNYVRARDELGVDFVNHPELALVPEHAANIMILGMMQGWFTGRRLSSYAPADYVNMRKIINGTDRAQLIAGYARKFETALKA